MKTLIDLYRENPKLYAEWSARANREKKILSVVDDNYFLAEIPRSIDYKKQRAREYPLLKEQMDMLWHAIDTDSLNKDSDFYKELKKVKDKYPKPEVEND